MAEFQAATPELYAAARWALFAERVAPMLSNHRANLGLSLAGLPPAIKGQAAASKFRSMSAVPVLETLLYPVDRDG